MKIIFDEKFYDSTYASDCASVQGRIEAIIEVLSQKSSFNYAKPFPAEESDLIRAHSADYVARIRQDPTIFKWLPGQRVLLLWRQKQLLMVKPLLPVVARQGIMPHAQLPGVIAYSATWEWR